ncbi:uncharacterized protein [Amphiura filiformis]|uniref:uncharacterized protein isoform X3 n=1 Tax=Amphiura filiformis TaxID=82378 RepID=UPI003B21B8E7
MVYSIHCHSAVILNESTWKVGWLKMNKVMLIITVLSALVIIAAAGPPDCGDVMCPADYDPQCGTDGITYSNLCALQASQCGKPSLQLAFEGECIQLKEGEKNGYCPAVTLDQVGICVNECSRDYDCTGTEKCCKNGCGFTCQRARTSKPGECPPINEDEMLCFDMMNPCKNDMSCEGVEKCCWTGCSPICMKSAPREGFCPKEGDATAGCDLPSCQEDHDCEPPQKCCPACGTKKCSTAEVPKPGLCPAVEEGMMGICMEGCSIDSDCEGTTKCCSNGCGHACKPPANNTCTFHGKEYLPGPVPDPDGCNSCFCTENGGVACTEMACSCDINDETIFMGDSYPKGDGCNTCKCRGDRDNLGMQCTDYYCGPSQPHSRSGYMKTFAIVSVCVGVIGIFITITVLLLFYNMHKKRSQAKRTAKVDDYGNTQFDNDAEPLPVKT